MSAETMSSVPPVGVSTGVGAPGGPSFSGEFGRGAFGPNVGGLHQPGLNNNLFSQTLELNVSSPVQTFDKNIGEVAFTHTEVLFDANTSHVQNSVGNIQIENTPHGNQPAISDLELQEVKADLLQAEKVKEAMLTVGISEQEAEKSVGETLTKTEEKKGLPAISNEATEAVGTQKKLETSDQSNLKKPSESTIAGQIYYEHDQKADAKRKEVAQKAVSEIAQEFQEGKIQEVTGKTIAENMPSDPQPDFVKSELLLKTSGRNDGSYKEAVKELESSGVIFSKDQAIQIIEKVLANNHAVKVAKTDGTSSATEEEVKKVLSG